MPNTKSNSEEPVIIETPPVTTGRETLLGASVLYVKKGVALVKLGERYGTIPAAELTGEQITMVDSAKLTPPPNVFTKGVDLNALAWQAGILTPKDASGEPLQVFFRLLMAAAKTALVKE